MELTKKLLEERMKALVAQKAQAIGQANAIEGGIITLRDLLSDLDREEPKEGVVDETEGPE